MTPPDIASNGLIARMTKVNFQPRTNPTMKPAKKAQNHWKKLPSLSPIPNCILLISL